MSPEQFQEVKKRLESLDTCYETAQKNYDNKNIVDRAMYQAIGYCRSTLRLHLMLA
jgi:hypothetical protein